MSKNLTRRFLQACKAGSMDEVLSSREVVFSDSYRGQATTTTVTFAAGTLLGDVDITVKAVVDSTNRVHTDLTILLTEGLRADQIYAGVASEQEDGSYKFFSTVRLT